MVRPSSELQLRAQQIAMRGNVDKQYREMVLGKKHKLFSALKKAASRARRVVTLKSSSKVRDFVFSLIRLSTIRRAHLPIHPSTYSSTRLCANVLTFVHPSAHLYIIRVRTYTHPPTCSPIRHIMASVTRRVRPDGLSPWCVQLLYKRRRLGSPSTACNGSSCSTRLIRCNGECVLSMRNIIADHVIHGIGHNGWSPTTSQTA